MDVQRKTLHQFLEDKAPTGGFVSLFWFHDVADADDLEEDRVAIGFFDDDGETSFTGIARLRADSPDELKALKAHCKEVWSGKDPLILIKPSDDGNSRPLIFMAKEDEEDTQPDTPEN